MDLERARREALDDRTAARHAHRAQHARAVRAAASARSRGVAHEAGAQVLHGRRQPERAGRAACGPAIWASTSCTSTCTRRSRRRTAAAGQARARWRWRRTSSRSCRCRWSWSSDGGAALDARPAAVDRARPLVPRQLRHPGARAALHLSTLGRPGSREVSRTAILNAELPDAAPGEDATSCRIPSTACTSSCSRAAASGSTASRRSTSPSGCSTSACTRRPSTSR